MLNILFIGDVVGEVGCDYLAANLSKIKRDLNVDLTIANGENSCQSNGISPESADFLLKNGVDLITSGNHVFRHESIKDYMKASIHIIRPYNMDTYIGNGFTTVKVKGKTLCVLNLMGTVFMNTKCSNPFSCVKVLLQDLKSDILVIDFHAETTSEKKAMGWFLDGIATAVLGTHTHIQTNDCQILPKGTAYITDVGMTGPLDSVLGVKKDIIVDRFLYNDNKKFVYADGPVQMDCVIVSIDENNKAKSIIPYNFL